MAVYDRPAFLDSQSMQWGIAKAGVQFTGPFNGTPQSINFVAERWTVSAALPPMFTEESGALEAFAMLMAGGVNRVRLHHEARPVPIGTMRGSPTIIDTVTRGANVITVRTAAFATLRAGDMIGSSGHLFMVATDTTADGNGYMYVSLVNRVRTTISAGQPVVWNKPTALFIVPSLSSSASHAAIVMESLALDFLEVYA